MHSLPRPPLVLTAMMAMTVMTGLALSACAPSNSSNPAGSTGSADGETESMRVLASFYPLQFVAERVGGENVEVGSVTPPGAEPHNLELSPAKVAELADASVVIYASGFQAAVDEAVEQTAPEHGIDVAEAAGLSSTDGSTAKDGEAADPHFWLDPERLTEVTKAVAERFSEADPQNADAYQDNADQLTEELSALDEEFSIGLATCKRRTIVVSHEAYGYLADRYDLEQTGVSGIDPEAEPAPARVAKIRRVIQGQDITTIFTESLVNPKVAETLAADLGVRTALLDPLESHAEASGDYLDIMRNNLGALQEALSCE
ncbi:metal ABC transporter substrate-binding protein [Arthrobacter sp. B0490]|uniref:metal ABC transporter substrate-binding protein n=1 Tax=Arthrobacter sp. B0490 TaxID=2058891 RepID=UPI0021579E39|nr:metal ABC transporter substrate-binding protein [Arthrobacter sp. B0490]